MDIKISKKNAILLCLHDDVIWYRLNQLKIADIIKTVLIDEMKKEKKDD